MPESDVTVSVIIVTCNSGPVLNDCLGAIAAAAGQCTFESIVVDNASKDNSLDIAESHHARIISNAANRGFAAACNQGARLAGGDYLLFLNPDVVPDPYSIERLVDACKTLPDAGLISARLRNDDGSYQPTSRRFPSLTNLIFSRGSILSHLLGSSARYTYGDFVETTEVDAVAGTFVLVSRERFNLVGRFDQRFFMYMEDTDLSRRLVAHGFANYIEPSAGGVHRWGRGSDALDVTRIRYHHRSMARYADKYFSIAARLILRFMLSINLGLRLLTGSPRSGH